LRIIEYVQGIFGHKEENRGMHVHMVNEGTKSNGHGEGKKERMNFMETIKSLYRDVLSHKSDSDRLTKSKELNKIRLQHKVDVELEQN